MFGLLSGSIWNSDCMEGSITNASHGCEAKSLNTFLPSGRCSNKQTKNEGKTSFVTLSK